MVNGKRKGPAAVMGWASCSNVTRSSDNRTCQVVDEIAEDLVREDEGGRFALGGRIDRSVEAAQDRAASAFKFQFVVRTLLVPNRRLIAPQDRFVLQQIDFDH